VTALLQGICGRDFVPVCLDIAVSEGPGDSADSWQEALRLLALYLKSEGISEPAAVEALLRWARESQDLYALDEAIAKDAIQKGYRSKKIWSCREYRSSPLSKEIECDEPGCLWIDEHRAEANRKSQPESDPGREQGGSSTGRAIDLINARIPAWIKEHHFKTAKDTGKIYHYEHGVYLDDGEVLLEALIEEEFSEYTSNKLIADVIGKVKRRTYIDRDAFNAGHFLNVKNGLLDLDTLELKPHTPDYLSTAQINVTYDENAKAPRIQKFLREVARPEDVALIEELIGWLLWPDYNIHAAVMLLGPGRNGKGTLLRLITAFLGPKSIANVTLQDLVADRFAKADLYGRLANIGGDLPARDLSDTAAFRNLTGGDDNRAQEKYRAAFNFRNKAKMLFSANQLPRSPDDTYAYYSRWILLEFLHTFDPRSGTGDPDLDSKLQTPEELSGLLNIALAGLKRLRENGWRFSYDKTVEDVEILYKRNSNPVVAFLMDECEEAPDSYVGKSVLQSRFRRYCEKHGIRPITVTRFGNLLKDQSVIPISDYRPHDPTGRVGLPRCWLGLKFKDPSNASIPSIVLPNPSITAKGEENKESSKGEIGYTESMDGVDAQNAAQKEHFKKMASEVAGPGLPAGEPEQAPPGEEPPGPEAHPDSGPHEPVEKVEPIPRPHCYLAKVRGAAIIEYGYSGWVDPAKVAKAAGILECQACRALLHLGYEQFERTGGGLGFKQVATMAGEASA